MSKTNPLQTMVGDVEESNISASGRHCALGDDLFSGLDDGGSSDADMPIIEARVQPAVVSLESTGLWPSQVPNQQQAYALLTGGKSDSIVAQQVTRQLLASLNDVEVAALWGRPLPLPSEELRAALILRWRLLFCGASRPDDIKLLNRASLEDLINEADGVLTSLLVPEGADALWVAAVEQTRGAIAFEVSLLIEVSAKIVAAEEAAAKVVPIAATPSKSHARMLSVNADTAKGPKKAMSSQKRLILATLVVAVIGAGFHLARLVPEMLAVPEEHGFGELKAIAGSVLDPTKMAMFTTNSGANPEPTAKLKSDIEAAGKSLVKLPFGNYVVLPKDKAAKLIEEKKP